MARNLLYYAFTSIENANAALLISFVRPKERKIKGSSVLVVVLGKEKPSTIREREEEKFYSAALYTYKTRIHSFLLLALNCYREKWGWNILEIMIERGTTYDASAQSIPLLQHIIMYEQNSRKLRAHRKRRRERKRLISQIPCSFSRKKPAALCIASTLTYTFM